MDRSNFTINIKLSCLKHFYNGMKTKFYTINFNIFPSLDKLGHSYRVINLDAHYNTPFDAVSLLKLRQAVRDPLFGMARDFHT